MSSDQHNTTECPMRDAAPAGERETIRAVFLRNGFTVKEGQTDLKPYVYAAAEELLSIARTAWQRTQSAGVPDVSAMARVLSDRSADACNIDRTDNWAMYGQEYIEDVQAMLAARAQPAAQDQGEVQRLREPTTAMVQAACAAFRMDISPMRAMHEALCAALSAQGEGERT